MKCAILLLACLSYCVNAQTFGAYVLTMGTPNYLNVYSGSSSGLTYVTQVATGGNGVPDAGPGVQSQGSVVVTGNYIFGVNPSSNTVSMFSIDLVDPTKVTLVGTPAPSGGQWPNAVTANKNSVCVANSGVQSGIRCFTYSSTGLTAVAGSDRSFALNLTTPPVSHTGPGQISITTDGTGIVVSNKGANPPLYLFSYNDYTGSVSANAVSSPAIGSVPFGFAFDTDGTLVLTDAAPTGTNGGLLLVGVTPATPALTYLTTQYFLLQNENAACWVTRSPQTGHFYVSNSASSTISDVARTGTTLSIVATIPLNSSKPLDSAIASLGAQDYLVVLSGNQQLFTLQLSSGGATVVQTLTFTNNPHSAGVATYVPAAVTSPATQTVVATVATQTGTVAHNGAGSLVASYLLLLAIVVAYF